MSRKLLGAMIPLLVLALCAVPVRSASAGTVIDRIAAIVNDDIITMWELRQFADTIRADIEDPAVLDSTLSQLIDRTLITQEAARLDISVTEAEVDIAIEGVKARFSMTMEQLEVALKEQSLTPEMFREQWRTQILTSRLMSRIVGGSIAVTDGEIREAYEAEHGAVETVSRTRISHILIRAVDEDEQALALARAQEMMQMAESGEDFDYLSKEYSDDSLSAEQGGDLGFWMPGDLAEPLEAAIAGAEVGSVVGPVKTTQGYHIIKITDIEDTGELGMEPGLAEQIKEKIYQGKVQKALATWITALKEKSFIENKI